MGSGARAPRYNAALNLGLVSHKLGDILSFLYTLRDDVEIAINLTEELFDMLAPHWEHYNKTEELSRNNPRDTEV